MKNLLKRIIIRSLGANRFSEWDAIGVALVSKVRRTASRKHNRHVLNTTLVKSFRSFGKKGHHVFFGYYDLNPFRHDDNKLLAMRVPVGPSTHWAEAEVGLYDLSAGEDAVPPEIRPPLKREFASEIW